MNKENNSKVDIILSIVLGVLFILAMLFIFFGYMQGKNHDQYNQHTDCENINTGWTYTKEGENKSIDFPNKIDCKYGETVVLSNTIPADFEDGFYIYVNTDSCSVDAYIDGEEIQVVGIAYTEENKKYENPIVVLVVPDGSSGKKIDLHVLNNGSKFRIEIYNILYGPKDEIRFNLTTDAIPIICAAVVMVSLAIMFGVISFCMHANYKSISEDYACLALFILVSAIWIFTDLTTQGAYFVGSESMYLAHMLSYMVFPIPFMMYINKQLDKRSKIIRCHTTVQMVFTVLVMLFFITNIFKYAYVLFVSHIVTCILLIEIAIIIILNILKHKKNNNILMLVGISILVVTGAMTVVNFYFNVSNDNTFAYKYGLIIFTCLVSVQSVMRGFKSVSERKTSEATYMLNKEYNILTHKKNILVAKYYIANNEIVYNNDAIEKRTTPEEFIKKYSYDKYEDDILNFFDSIKMGIAKGEIGFEGRIFNKKGYYTADYELVTNKDKQVVYALLNLSDTTESHELEERFKEVKARADEIVENGGCYFKFNLTTGLLEDCDNKLFTERIKKNASLKELSEYINKFVLTEADKLMVDLMFSAEKLYSIYGKDTSQNFEIRLNIDENEVWAKFTLGCLLSKNGKDVIVVVVVENVEAEKKYLVDNITGLDRITGLYNTNSFRTEVKVALERLDSSKCHTLVLIQIDEYDKIMEEYGSSITNLVLKDLGNMLKDITRDNDIIARINIDTFALFMPYTPSTDSNNVKLITRICEEMTKTYYDKLTVTCSLGVAVYPNDGVNLDKLLEGAQNALNKATANGKGKFAYNNDEIKNRNTN